MLGKVVFPVNFCKKRKYLTFLQKATVHSSVYSKVFVRNNSDERHFENAIHLLE